MVLPPAASAQPNAIASRAPRRRASRCTLMFVAGSSHRAAEHAGDAAVEAWCESEDTPAVSMPPTGAACRLIEETADDVEALKVMLEMEACLASCGTSAAAEVPQLEAYAANRAAWRRLLGGAGCVLPPRVVQDPRAECPRLDVPFVTDECGSVPIIPDGLEQTIDAYLPARPREEHEDETPDFGYDGSGKLAASWLNQEGVRMTLRAADADGRRYWAAFSCDQLRQPAWWPAAATGAGGVGSGPGSVPLYDQVIVGRGATGIGLHADAYGHGSERKLVATCLTIARGSKHVLLLPPACAKPGAPTMPDDAWADVAASFPFAPTPATLRRIAEAGGFLFRMRAVSEAEGRSLALFLPAGWLHWLVGDGRGDGSEVVAGEESSSAHGWHALYGGSFFPDCHVHGVNAAA